MPTPTTHHNFSRIRSNFWFVPSCLASLSIALAILSIYIDQNLLHQDIRLWFVYQGTAEGARTVLATLAGAMMTAAGVIFSVTIVALSIASSQLGPRLLKDFIRDITNQSVLGIFIATFLYCILILLAVNGTEGSEFVPQLSITASISFTMISIAALIFFIHHASVSIQADHIIARVDRTLKHSIEKLYPHISGQEDCEIKTDAPSKIAAAVKGKKETAVRAQTTGYIQVIDVAGLLQQATDMQGIFRIKHKPGNFIMPQSELVSILTDGDVHALQTPQIAKCFIVGSERTEEQDIEFALEQMVQIALRALSPGINDPLTAITCVDHISSALNLFAEKEVPDACVFGRQGELRLLMKTTDFSGLVNAAFNQIRQSAQNNPSIMIRLLERICDLIPNCRTQSQRAALLQQADMIRQSSTHNIPQEKDRRDIEERLRQVHSVNTAFS